MLEKTCRRTASGLPHLCMKATPPRWQQRLLLLGRCCLDQIQDLFFVERGKEKQLLVIAHARKHFAMHFNS